MSATANYFYQSGLLYTEPNFWSAEECWQLREISRFCPTEEAGVYAEGKHATDSPYRKTTRVVLMDSVAEELHRSILTSKSRVENHFGINLRGLQPCQLLQYNEGGFFRPHQDEKESTSNVARQISVIVFVNSSVSGMKTVFEGGEIIFYQDMEHHLAQDGFHFQPEEGLLLAFQSSLIHEVAEITKGTRFSVVSWFF